MKNRSIINVRNNTTNAQVRKHANKLICHTHELVEVTFVKKNGTTRKLLTLPCLEWNKLINKPTTKQGRKGTAKKTSNNIINVVEIVVSQKPSQTKKSSQTKKNSQTKKSSQTKKNSQAKKNPQTKKNSQAKNNFQVTLQPRSINLSTTSNIQVI